MRSYFICLFILFSCQNKFDNNKKIENIESSVVVFEDLPSEVRQVLMSEESSNYLIDLSNFDSLIYQNTSYVGLYPGEKIFQFKKCTFWTTSHNNDVGSPIIYTDSLFIYMSKNSNRHNFEYSRFYVIDLKNFECFNE